jgi:hypothetical protein
VAVMRPDEDFSPEIYVNIATFWLIRRVHFINQY